MGTSGSVLCPLPTMRLRWADPSCHPSIQIPLISAAHAYTGRQAAAWTCSVTPPLPGFLQRRQRGPHGDPNRQSKGSSIKSGSVGTLGGKRQRRDEHHRGGRSNRERQKQTLGGGGGGWWRWGRPRKKQIEIQWRAKEAEPGSVFV